MKRLIIWLAKKFNVILVTEKIVYKDRIVEKIVEVPVEVTVIKEVTKEVPVEVVKEVIKYVPNPDTSDATKYDGIVETDLTINGNLLVTGILTVQGEVTCYKIK